MDSSTVHQQQQQSQPSATRNIKNLSIKEFFTTRLMRARSFEGGANSPKDETSNWFDEFKARMTKKSQANANKQALSGPGNSTVEESNDESSDYGDSATKSTTSQAKQKIHQNKEDNPTSSVKENCDTPLNKLTEFAENYTDLSDPENSQVPQESSNLATKIRFSGLRARKVQRISSVESPDFDTASINTIFNRRDSRYEIVKRKPHKLLLSKVFALLKWIISYLLPFNYNLPWKLLTLINFSFVIIVVGLSRETGPELMTFNFFNGFMCGLLVNTICFMILLLSLIVHVLPDSQKVTTDDNIIEPSINESLKSSPLSFIETKETGQATTELPDLKPEDFSSFEVLDSGDPLSTNDADGVDRENLLDDDDYKGWMIEFIGDYELRNKSDIKLKLLFVRIENRILYLCKPKNSHDAEFTSFPVFVQQRQYNLNTARKFSANLLLPRTVRNRQKWVWSKKYPIRLEFQEENEQNLKVPDGATKMVQLTLFAKSCREKEEWFRRFKRIVEENRINQGQGALKRASIHSELSEDPEDASVRSFGRSPSPSGRQDCVQTSRSSHILGDAKRLIEEENKIPESNSNLVRTKSCELLHTDQAIPSVLVANQDSPNEEGLPRFGINSTDDSTLTRETAELFSQAVEYSNFIDSQPNLIYRDYIQRVIDSSQDASKTSDWFNSLTGRIFFDVFSHNYWSLWFKRKIQRKLYRIRLPYFMETLTLTKIDLGENAPQFLNVVSHSFDSFGLSIDFDMAYSGGLTMTFETKLNLLKIKSDNSSTSNPFGAANQSASANSSSNTQNQSSATSLETTSKESSSASESSFETSKDVKKTFSSPGSTRTSGESSDSDEDESDSSSDSSFDEADVDEISDWEDYGAEKTRQSIVRFVDKIASSRYFQHATENRYIKKKLQDISNCPLVLVVKIESLNGVLTLNVPPPQTDRVWYGFKPNPELTLKALPKMGDREVNLSHVTDWIEKKLAEEFRKILVIPNMEDIVLPVLKSDHLLYVTSTK